ncbi:acyl CoA--acetate/3-ketoacid CoA transferase subunit alpha [Pseudomonas sp. PDM28]|uniref:CoA transferase subunit A n=1 Tax=Pseudomonas sp. PDM28 TaxID=2854770 RepID=UPI001C46307C|nr:CoA-transferase [Pseudomonas sp. PDM28]MBV7551474.1 acyl CoA--acetate/3-ketoacid CoA transferase subunit alpha [Pseudomonas sp. PDM28]
MNKELSAKDVVARLRDGMTVGIGGWGPRRKPMAIVRELLRSDLKDLTIVSYGGPEVGMLCAAGKVRKLIFGFVTLDAIPLEPYFRKAREAGELQVMELDEGMFEWGLRAAGMRMSFLPTRCGLGTDVLDRNPDLRTVRSPYDDGEVYVAMPALNLDVALIHVNESDRLGNTLVKGGDPLFDHLFARAAKECYVSTEVLHDCFGLAPEMARLNFFERYLVTGVVHAPFGAHPTYSGPDYGWDLEHLKRYCASATQENGWQGYVDEFIACSEAEYLSKVGGAERVSKLPLPIF